MCGCLTPLAGVSAAAVCVQGARPHYCINSAVIRKGNIDAECEELLKDGMGCKYKKNANSIGHGHVKVIHNSSSRQADRQRVGQPCASVHRHGNHHTALRFCRNSGLSLYAVVWAHCLQVHDIEDLAKIGKRHTACPYLWHATWPTQPTWCSAPTATCWTQTYGGRHG